MMSLSDRGAVKIWIQLVSLLVPVLGTFVYGFVVIGRSSFDDVMNESMFFAQGFALIWNLTDWWPTHHLMPNFPSIPVVEASALFVKMSGISVETMNGFWKFSLGLSVGWAVLMCCWSARLSVLLRLPPFISFACAAMVVLNPVTVAMPLHAYYFFGIMLLPIGLGVAALSDLDNLAHPSVLLTLPALGFASSLHYMALLLIFMLFVALIVSLVWVPPFRARVRDVVNQFPKWLRYVGLLATGMFIASFLVGTANIALGKLGKVPGVNKAIILEIGMVVAGIVVVWALIRIRLIQPFLEFASLVSIGWLVGVNILYREFIRMAYGVFSSRVVDVELDFATFSAFGFLHFRTWNYWVPVVFCVSLFAIWTFTTRAGTKSEVVPEIRTGV